MNAVSIHQLIERMVEIYAHLYIHLCMHKIPHLFYHCDSIVFGPRREKTCLRRLANNKGVDQPVHPRSLISAFVTSLLGSTISQPTTSELSIF